LLKRSKIRTISSRERGRAKLNRQGGENMKSLTIFFELIQTFLGLDTWEQIIVILLVFLLGYVFAELGGLVVDSLRESQKK
jgi:hypothetical protein